MAAQNKMPIVYARTELIECNLAFRKIIFIAVPGVKQSHGLSIPVRILWPEARVK